MRLPRYDDQRYYFKCDKCGKEYSCKHKDLYEKPAWFSQVCQSCARLKTPQVPKDTSMT